ncbi:hypothetical protein [Methylobacterium aquaticum]|uniref:hypothetical protein n=1 Tax=Methylobacterium aquaticum TaxID=270351 RepID=UPI001934474B|nr:hypothetical protein [Methylobacterium aquaticum]QRE73249.1 hypothetical protein F1D61_06010 [Methylobacterium aquaticum]
MAHDPFGAACFADRYWKEPKAFTLYYEKLAGAGPAACPAATFFAAKATQASFPWKNQLVQRSIAAGFVMLREESAQDEHMMCSAIKAPHPASARCP